MSAALRELSGRDALDALGADLDDLLAATGAPVTCRRPWLAAWAQAYADWSPWVLAVPDAGGGLAAVAALARRRRGPATQVVALGTGPSDETRLPARDDAAAVRLATGVAAAVGRLRGPWSLRVEQLPPDCPVLRELAPLLPVAEVVPGDGLPRVDALPEWSAHLSRSARQSERTGRNRAAKEGREVTASWTADPAEVEAALPELSAVHRARDAQLGRRSDHLDERAWAFYVAVVRAHAARGEVELLRVRVDGALASYSLALRDGRSLCVWDSRVDPEHVAYGAGRWANHEALRRVCADPELDVLDWMRGEEAYKLTMATRVTPTADLRAWSSRAARSPSATVAAGRRLRSSNPLAAKAFAALGKPPPREV